MRGRTDDALLQLSTVVQQAGDNGLTHYNAGLVYLELKRFDLALAESHQALRLGYGGTALQEELQRSGHWKDPAAPSDAASGPAR